MKLRTTISAIALLCTTSLTASAESVAPTGARGVMVGESRVVTVTQVDQASREVTLRNADGEERTFVAGDDVRNLAQVEVGDKVTITYGEALAVRLYPATVGSKGRVGKTQVSRAPLGAKPYGKVTRQVEITGKVAELDHKTRLAKLEGKYRSLTLRVADDVDLTKVAVGDMVRVDYLESITISVDAPKK